MHLNLTGVMGTSHEDRCTHIISVSVLLTTRNISDKCYGEDQNTRLMYNPVFPKIVVFFLFNVDEYGRTRQVTDDNMAHAHCMLHN